MTVHMTPQPYITVFTSNGKPLTKRFTLGADGEINKETLGSLYKGTAEVAPAPTAAALDAALSSLTHGQAVATGRPIGADSVKIGVQGKLQPGEVMRGLDAFGFAPAPGYLLIDYDTGNMPTDVAARIADLGGPVEALFHIWPEARQAAHVIRPSSSGGVTRQGEAPGPIKGLHAFILIEDVSRSKEALEALGARAWAAGLGWIKLSASGATLSRCIVDLSVGSPERLIFEAPPIVEAPLVRHVLPSIVSEGAAALIPAMPGDLLGRAQGIEAKARSDIAPKAKATEDAFIKSRAKREASRSGVSLPKAMAAVRQMMKGGVLKDNQLLQLKNGSWAKVGDLLDNEAGHKRLALPDPIEGLAYGADKATLFLAPRPGHADDKPRLVSHAHGQRTVYRFERYKNPPPPPIKPVYPAPTGDRETGLKATTRTIGKWGKKSAREALARRTVAAGYDALDELLEPNERTKAQQKIRRAVRDQFGLDYLPTADWRKGSTSLRWMITGAQGVGKTAALVGGQFNGIAFRGALHDGAGLVSVFFSPSHKQSRQALTDYLLIYDPHTDPIPVLALGRGAEHPDDKERTACNLADQTTQAAALGVNVQKTFCQNCPFASDCAYLARIREIEAATADPRGAVIFGVHDHAFVKMAGVDRADRYIFDERVRSFAYETFSIAIDDWHRDLREFLDWTGQSAGATADALSDLLSLILPVRTAIGRAVQETPETALKAISDALSGIAKEGETPADVAKRAAGQLHQFNADRLSDRLQGEMTAFQFGQANGGKQPSLESRLERQLEASDENHVRNLIRIMQAVAVELEQGHGERLRAVYTRQHRKAPRIVAEVIEAANLPDNAPLLHLDGTGDPDLAAAWFGPLQQHHHPVERLTNDAIFVSGHSFSTVSLTGINPKTNEPVNVERATVMRQKMRAVIERRPGAFVAAPKKALDALGDFPGHVTGWFGNLRGSNRAKDCETAIIIGRNLPPPLAVEQKARAFAVALDRPFEPIAPTYQDGRSWSVVWPKRDEGIRMADGTGHPVEVEYHPDPTGQAVVRQLRDAEASQALDRVRAQYNTRSFMVMGACIPDMTFTKVETWKTVSEGGTRLERAIAGVGVVPLSESEAVAIAPAIWPNRKSAQRDQDLQQVKGVFYLSRLGGTKRIKEYLIHNVPPKDAAVFVAYQRPKKEGRGGHTTEQMAIVYAPPQSARETLEKLTGPLAGFRILEMSEGAIAAEMAAERAAIQAEAAPAILRTRPDREDGAVWGQVCPLPRIPPQSAVERLTGTTGPPG